jgi:hypothetical protein
MVNLNKVKKENYNSIHRNTRICRSIIEHISFPYFGTLDVIYFYYRL